MNFKQITIDDINIIQPYLYNSNIKICDYTIGGLFMWRDYFKMEYCIKNDILFSRLYNSDGQIYYNIPLGGDLKNSINLLKEELNETSISFCTIPQEEVEKLKQIDNNCYVLEQQEFADYLYSANDLVSLSGKKFSGQRNMIHQFMREHSSFSYEDISTNNVNELLNFLKENYHISNTATNYEIEEENKVIEVINNLDKYGFVGSVLKVENQIVGFSLGEIIDDTIYVHIEKANRNIKGAYQMIVNLFAKKYVTENIKFINREEDMGDIGLKTSKLSYHPINLIKKYIVKL